MIFFTPLACRSIHAPAGALLVPARYCPNLRELELGRCGLGVHAAAPFKHLTRLCLTDFHVSHWRFTLNAAMPRLEALHCGRRCRGAIAAVAGHPSLREVWLDVMDCVEPDVAHDKLAGLKRLPRLSALKLRIDQSCFKASGSSDDEDEDSCRDDNDEGPAPDGCTCMLRTLEHLRRCARLTSLELDTRFELPAPQALSLVGAALGDRLESLSIRGMELARSPADAARTLRALPLAFPRLTSLTLSLFIKDWSSKDNASSPTVRSLLALFRPLDQLLPRAAAAAGAYSCQLL